MASMMDEMAKTLARRRERQKDNVSHCFKNIYLIWIIWMRFLFKELDKKINFLNFKFFF